MSCLAILRAPIITREFPNPRKRVYIHTHINLLCVRVYLCFVYFRKVNHFTVPFGTPGGMCVWFRPELTSSSASDRSSVFPCFRNNLQSVGGGLDVPRTWQFLFRSNVKIKLRNPYRVCVCVSVCWENWTV